MAQSKSFFGLRRGSTKTLTFQVNNGKQITKDRVESVKNPRTQSQMVQRMVMATASAAYSAMRLIVDHSFEGVSYGQPSMSKFTSENAKLLRANMQAATSKFGYNKFQNRAIVPGAYLMSDGSLAAPAFSYTLSSNEGSFGLVLLNGTAATALTASALAAALGLQVGEMVTICTIYGNAEATGHNFAFIRFKCKAVGDTVVTAENIGQFLEVETNAGAVAAPVLSASGISYTITADINDATAMTRCAIYSRQGTTGWLRSKAVMEIPAGMVLAPTAAEAIATYPVGADYILNGGNF